MKILTAENEKLAAESKVENEESEKMSFLATENERLSSEEKR